MLLAVQTDILTVARSSAELAACYSTLVELGKEQVWVEASGTEGDLGGKGMPCECNRIPLEDRLLPTYVLVCSILKG